MSLVVVILAVLASLEGSSQRMFLAAAPDTVRLDLFPKAARLVITGSPAHDWDAVSIRIRKYYRDPVIIGLKERVGPIWLTKRQFTLSNVPELYVYGSYSRRTEASLGIAQDTLAFGAVTVQTFAGGAVEDSLAIRLRQEWQAIQREQGGYFKTPVVAEGRRGFRAEIDLPQGVRPGVIEVEAVAYSGETEVQAGGAQIRVAYAGTLHAIASLSERRPLLYSLLSVAAALLTGLAAGLLTR